MKLKQFLKKHRDEFVYVGSASSFLYIGMAGDSEEWLKKESDKWLANYKSNLRKNQTTLDRLPNRIKANEKSRIELEAYIPIAEKHVSELKKQLMRYISDSWASNIDPEGEDDPEYVRLCNEIPRFSKIIRQLKHELVLTKSRSAELKEQLERLPSNVESLRNIVDDWKDFGDRDVLTHYKRIMVKPYGIIITIEGKENGNYWDYYEWLHDHKTIKEITNI